MKLKQFIFMTLLIGILSVGVNAQTKKVTELTADTVPTSDDLTMTVNDPAGTPASRKVTLANLFFAMSPWSYCSDAGSNDTYACSLSPAPSALVTGNRYRFLANTVNTGAATINFNSIGAKTIKKLHDQDLADGDIEAGQWVDVIYDGTNMQMVSQIANAGGGGAPGGSSGDYQYNDGAGAFAGGSVKRIDANTTEIKNSTNAQTTRFYKSDNGAGTYSRIVIQNSSGRWNFETESNGGGSGDDLALKKGTTALVYNGSTFVPSTDGTINNGSGSNAWNETHSKSFWVENASGRVQWSGRARVSSQADGALQIETASGSGTANRLTLGDVNDNGISFSAATSFAEIKNGNVSKFAYLKDAGRARVSTQFDKTNTTLANVTGLATDRDLVSGSTYTFEADLFINADATGGSKFAISGTATATSIVYEIMLLDDSTGAYTHVSRQTALNGSGGQAGTTAGYCRIKGTIVVNAGGTLTVQFAQNAASGTSSVLVNSTLRVEKW